MKDNPLATPPKNWRWPLAAILLILLASSLPTLAGVLTQTQQQRYIGIPFNTMDYAVHTAMIQAGQQGELSYQLRFTSEPHSPALIRTFYVLLGWCFWFVPATWLFQIARLAFGGLALWAVYRLCRLAFPEDMRLSRLAFLLAALGGGVGWLQIMLGQISPEQITPLDLWFIDGYLFRVILLFPHMSATVMLLALSFSELLAYHRDGQLHRLVRVAGMAILTQVINPIAFLLLDAALAGLMLYRLSTSGLKRGEWATFLLVVTAQLPLLFYSAILLTTEPIWSIYTAQNKTLSPPPGHFVFGFLPLWLLAVIGLPTSLRHHRPIAITALAWITCALLCIYLPVNIQRRFMIAITLPLGLLAAIGLQRLLATIRNPALARIALPGLLAFSMLSHLVTLAAYTSETIQRTESLFFPAVYEQTAVWLHGQSDRQGTLLASETASRLMAAQAGVRVFSGHPMETIHYEEKMRQVQGFYTSSNCRWLEEQGIRWVVYGPYEQQYNPAPPECANYESALSLPGLTLYKRITP